ncbi:U11/U12 small nuclear ribonucleoprotein 65 kDa protein-like isoform X1 [Rhagoletis pomonella]|uniref:U11/U12 small nuclear ribonucleoprotein 65 kDa protein-like isoform X1 n=1 Tax=Rhagoletis pomonella TaxID=28610 RepID=UPI00177C0983|nr:U11/U12 small nuclear ribonucleoprotein 65 kDa protein-like isoform X1 [Rhagoletis pomonella]
MDNSDASTLLIKNIPKSISDITNLLPYAPKELKQFGRRRVLVTYENEAVAQTVLQQLQQLELIPGKHLNAAFFRKNEKPAANVKPSKKVTSSKTTQTSLHTAGDAAAPQISKYVSKLYACDAKLNFVQPPPPYLKYAYPRITPDILDAISIALMSNTRFYTQVLHLMNRMNLEPPFGTKPTGMSLLRRWPRDVGTQTANENVEVGVEKVLNVEARVEKTLNVEQSRRQTEKSESELESSEEDECRGNKTHGSTSNKVILKRKGVGDLEEQYKKKARQLLQATLHQQKQSNQADATADSCSKSSELQNVFEQTATAGKARKIALKLQPQKPKKSLEAFVPPIELSAERLTVEQLQELPIYKNYQIGAPTNKLYIKNLSKDVCEEDLRQLYSRFVAADCLDIKVMQQGRMKGQAFVTFNGLSEVDAAAAVSKALTETNGFVLRQKPMVVCYGKK